MHRGIERSGHTRAVEAIVLAPDKKQLASASSDGTARLWDLESQLAVRTFSGHTSRLNSLDFSIDGRWLATGSLDRTIRIWSMASDESVTLTSNLDGVQSVAFSPDGRELAVGDRGGALDLWRTADGEWAGEVELDRSWRAHQGRTYWLVYSPHGGSIVSAGQDGHLTIWNRPATPLRQTVEPQGVSDMSWVPERRWFAVAEQVGVRLYDSTTCQAVKTFPTPAACLAVAATSDGRRLAAFDRQGQVRLWKMEAATSQWLSEESSEMLSWNVGQALAIGGQLAFSPDNSLLALAAFNINVTWLFDVESGRLHTELPVPDCWSPAFSPDSRRLAIASLDDVLIWDLEQRDFVQVLSGHSSTVNTVAYSPDGRSLASGSNDRLIKLWDTATGAERYSLSGHRGYVKGLSFSPDGRSLVSGSEDREIRLWHVATGRPLYQFDRVDVPMWKLLFSSDGSQLVSLGGDPFSTLLLYDTGVRAE